MVPVFFCCYCKESMTWKLQILKSLNRKWGVYRSTTDSWWSHLASFAFQWQFAGTKPCSSCFLHLIDFHSRPHIYKLHCQNASRWVLFLNSACYLADLIGIRGYSASPLKSSTFSSPFSSECALLKILFRALNWCNYHVDFLMLHILFR